MMLDRRQELTIPMYLKLYATCIPVKGYLRSLICNFIRNKYDYIPNILYEILTTNQALSMDHLVKLYGEANREHLEEYFNFLLTNDYAFTCDEHDLRYYAPMDLQFHSPNYLSNFILDIADEHDHDYEKIFFELYCLQCPNIQIRIFSKRELSEIQHILDYTTMKNFRDIQLIIPHNDNTTKRQLVDLQMQFSISRIDVHSTPQDKLRSLGRTRSKFFPVYFHSQEICDETHCGIISMEYFSIDLRTFTESLHFNNCLNRKASVDRFGNIKNCPSMATSFGNSNTESLIDVISKPEFQSKWQIKKDNISICNDCEYRFICTDCRAYLTDPTDNLSKPAKCKYDPYTAQWAE